MPVMDDKYMSGEIQMTLARMPHDPLPKKEVCTCGYNKCPGFYCNHCFCRGAVAQGYKTRHYCCKCQLFQDEA
jgi:hypothetical protein